MRRPKLLFYCQHSLGLGHLYRSLALCEELSQAFAVTLLCGGKMPQGITVPKGVAIVTLPPLGAAVDGRLVSRDGRRSLERARELRRDLILETFRSSAPDVVLVEFFPFGKKRFEDELVPLLEEARSRGTGAPLVVSSIRDILVSRGAEQQGHDDHASELANRLFDAVLVHSDPDFARFEESFRPRVPLRTPIHYTGFVVSNGVEKAAVSTRRPEIVVSAGGGIVGERLLRAAIGAHRLVGAELGMRMKVIAGPFLPDEAWRSLRAEAAELDGLTLRKSVPSLLAELGGATASVSQCGYNTALDILRSGVPALVVPFADGEEDEQTKRAQRLQERGALRVLDPEALTAAALARELRILCHYTPQVLSLDLEGGPNSARIVAGLLAARNGSLAEASGR